MTLEFRPPPDWLAQQYVDRKQPAEVASESIQQALQTYGALSQQRKVMEQTKQQHALESYLKAFEVGGPQFAGDIAKRTGLQNPPALPNAQPPMASTGTAASPVTAGIPAPGQSDPAISPSIQASLAAGHPNPMNHPMPDQSQIDQWTQQGKFGQNKLAEAKTSMEMAKLQKDLQGKGPLKTLTKEQALSQGTFDPEKQMLVEPPDKSAEDQRYSNEQDRLEQQARDGLTKLRGDQSLARVENQRDASIQAYNTIDKVKKGELQLSKAVYYDILGQMWKARTGASPTDQAIKDLDQNTFKGDISKAANYFTGFNPAAGATTDAVLKNLQDFAADSGTQADKFHSAYMATHKIKPSRLEDARWKPIFEANRGLSFAEGTGAQVGGVPEIGGTFQGGKVLSVKRIK